jgi:hypothetical protein
VLNGKRDWGIKTSCCWTGRCERGGNRKWKECKSNHERCPVRPRSEDQPFFSIQSSFIYTVIYPGLGINLYSIGSATDAVIEVHFANNTVTFSHKKIIIMEGKWSGKEALSIT